MRIEIAKNLLKAGFSVDVIYRATGLSTDEYNNTEKEICTDSADCTIGQRIKYWRLRQRYTQKDLANRVGVSQQQIQKYETGKNDVPRENLHALVRELSVDIIAPQPIPKKDENKDSETGIISLMEECNKINNQELLNILDLLACFLCENIQACKKEVIKAVKVEVA